MGAHRAIGGTDGPVVVFDQTPGGDWNVERLFRGDTVVTRGDTVPGFGDWVRLENVTSTIMQVFNLAGNRAIMIGIGLGVVSTSLKILLGVDRSYLGSERE